MSKSKPVEVGTKLRLLSAAERLIAEKGFDAVSIRDVTGLAAANVAAVNYHFGSREGLLASVLDRHLIPLARQRVFLLQGLTSAHDVPAVLRVWIQPLLEISASEGLPATEWYRILGRSMEASGMGQRDCLEAERAAQQTLRDCLLTRLDEQQSVGLAWRLHFATGGLIHLLVHGDEVESPFSMVEALERWVQTVVQGLGLSTSDPSSGSGLTRSAPESAKTVTAVLPSVAQQVAATMHAVAIEPAPMLAQQLMAPPVERPAIPAVVVSDVQQPFATALEPEVAAVSALVEEATAPPLPQQLAVPEPAPKNPSRKKSNKSAADEDLFLF